MLLGLLDGGVELPLVTNAQIPSVGRAVAVEEQERESRRNADCGSGDGHTKQRIQKA